MATKTTVPNVTVREVHEARARFEAYLGAQIGPDAVKAFEAYTVLNALTDGDLNENGQAMVRKARRDLAKLGE